MTIVWILVGAAVLITFAFLYTSSLSPEEVFVAIYRKKINS